LTHKVRKNIVQEYKKFYEKGVKNVYRKVSNHPVYSVKNGTMPTIAEHDKCLDISGSIGCVDRKPEQYKTLSLESSTFDGFSGYSIAGTAISALLVYSILGCLKCKPKNTHFSEPQDSVKPTALLKNST
jgi:hypothetical protein